MSLTWPELRASALVGTEKRAVRADAIAGLDPAALPDATPERLALHAAALLGAQQQAGALPSPVTGDAPGPPRPEPPEPEAPPEAVQLLELLLGGNLGPAWAVAPFATHWFVECRRAGRVVPHRLLVRVLDHATADAGLHPNVRACLGRRGAWLAGRREAWSWAAADLETPTAIEPEALAELGKAERVAALRAVRVDDPDRGRALLDTLLPDLDAATRTDLLGCLAVGLGPDDEPLLEAALDDRSKNVRRVAISLLDGLPGSARARRLTDVLAPLISIEGRLRPTITVAMPEPPDGELARDLPPPDGSLVAEAHWLRTLVAGVPLAWWETTLGDGPAKLLGRRFEPADDLVAGWSRAAVAERSTAWAATLLRHRSDPGLWALAGAASPELVAEHLKRTEDWTERIRTLEALPRPWSPPLADAVLRTARRSKHPRPVVDAIATAGPGALPVESLPTVQRWLDRTSPDDDQMLHRALRRLVQSLTVHQSITEAFA